MDTMTLTTMSEFVDADALTDRELETWFAALGVEVTVVPHCDDAGCGTCFPAAVRAA
ncbi:MAG: hypothetical protein R2823_02345 [Acidimicrobiia bacterium]